MPQCSKVHPISLFFSALTNPFLSGHVDLEEGRFGLLDLRNHTFNYLGVTQNNTNQKPEPLERMFYILRNMPPFLTIV